MRPKRLRSSTEESDYKPDLDPSPSPPMEDIKPDLDVKPKLKPKSKSASKSKSSAGGGNGGGAPGKLPPGSKSALAQLIVQCGIANLPSHAECANLTGLTPAQVRNQLDPRKGVRKELTRLAEQLG